MNNQAGDLETGAWKVQHLAQSDPDVAAYLAHQAALLQDAQVHWRAERRRVTYWEAEAARTLDTPAQTC